MERIILKMQYEIESCENRIDEAGDCKLSDELKIRMKTIKEFLHHIEAEVNFTNDFGKP